MDVSKQGSKWTQNKRLSRFHSIQSRRMSGNQNTRPKKQKNNAKGRKKSRQERNKKKRAPGRPSAPVVARNLSMSERPSQRQNLMKHKILGGMLPAVRNALLRILLAGMYTHANGVRVRDAPRFTPVVPRTGKMPAELCFESVQEGGFTLDLIPTLSAMAQTNVPTSGPTATPVWAPGSFKYVTFHDPYCPLILPVAVTGNRAWLGDVSFLNEDLVYQVDMPTTPYTTEMTFASTPWTAASTVPSYARTKPVCMVSDGSSNAQYVWLDACKALTTDVTFTMNATIAGSGATVAVNVSLLRYCGTYDDDQIVDASAGTLAIGVNFFVATLAVQESGYYRASATFTKAGGGTITRVSETTTTLNITEKTVVMSAHVANQHHVAARGVAGKFWLAGSGVLASARVPPLSTQGVILAAVPDKTYWPDVVADAANSIINAPTMKSFNGQEGGKLTEGIWAYSRPEIWPNEFQTLLTMPVSTGSHVAGLTPCIARILPGLAPLGMKVVDMSFTTTATVLNFRFTTSVAVIYTCRNQVVEGSLPDYLSADEWGALQEFLTTQPHFTSNDWHSALAAVANVGSKVVNFLERASLGFYRVGRAAAIFGQAAAMV